MRDSIRSAWETKQIRDQNNNDCRSQNGLSSSVKHTSRSSLQKKQMLLSANHEHGCMPWKIWLLCDTLSRSRFANIKKYHYVRTSNVKFHGLDKLYTIIYLACFKFLKIEPPIQNRILLTAIGFFKSLSMRYSLLAINQMIIIFCEVY